MSSYVCCARPDASHGYPYLVFDGQGELHLPLIVFAKEAQPRLAPSSLQKYLTNILPFFSWLDTDAGQHTSSTWCSRTSNRTSGRSCTCRRSLICPATPSNGCWQWAQISGRCRTTSSGLATCIKVRPACPGCPPVCFSLALGHHSTRCNRSANWLICWCASAN